MAHAQVHIGILQECLGSLEDDVRVCFNIIIIIL